VRRESPIIFVRIDGRGSKLASLILNDLVEKDATLIDEKDIWTEEDQQDLIAFSLQYVSHDN
jgi:hypothetical protein